MSFATRCTACGTIFRVVQDQLRVSEGWVRCGRCAEVFDAREQLFDMEREAPPPWPPTPPEPAALADVPESQDALIEHEDAFAPEEEAQPQRAMPPAQDATWVMPRDSDERPRQLRVEVDPHSEAEHFEVDVSHPAPMTQGRREPYWSGAGEDADLSAPAGTDATAVLPAIVHEEKATDTAVHLSESLTAYAAAANDAPASPAPHPQVSFLRQADGLTRWQRPRVRVALSLLALLLGLLLLAQFVFQYRNALMALYPSSEPWLQSVCTRLGCELQPWQRIDALAVENSSLTQAGSGNHYKLTVQLHNKAGYALALPWVDLSLTDAAGTLVARRMIKPAEFSAAKTVISADGEESLQLVFSTGKQKISGYSVEIFHP